MAKTDQVAIIEKKISPIVVKAEELSIQNAEDMSVATEMLSQVNKYADSIEAEKEKVTKPLNQALKAERARWKPIEEICDKAVSLIRRKMTDYQTAAVAKQKEEEQKIADRVGEGKGKLKVETAVRKMGEIAVPESSVATDAGMVKFKTIKKFEVTSRMDLVQAIAKRQIDINFIDVNEVKVREAMQKGISLPGIRYYEEQVPANFR